MTRQALLSCQITEPLNALCEQTIYVFNKYYLDFDLNDVLHELRVNPPLQPPIEGARLEPSFPHFGI